jgi:hypothetical protein
MESTQISQIMKALRLPVARSIRPGIDSDG